MMPVEQEEVAEAAKEEKEAPTASA